MNSNEKVFYKKVSKRMTQALNHSQYTIQDLSKELGIPYYRIYRAMTGDTNISLIDYVKVCMLLGVPFDTFIFEEA